MEAEAEKCQRKLDLAQRLMKSLGSEGARWAQTIDDLKEQVSRGIMNIPSLGLHQTTYAKFSCKLMVR